ncbi:uncharacterized protein LOC110852005 isoform X2 [Folsomia candida]|uniref:Uncharacterized protein n=1 Tax=Folsomia candida TaxID=158441 RepID=A0A226E229_FOLCA|nr:uncharacterized protein LOC110852005 isoform X2 [Folsomia candida]OXA51489.1 hypothetical protein Fcan01_13365 [Folsomia candida]
MRPLPEIRPSNNNNTTTTSKASLSNGDLELGGLSHSGKLLSVSNNNAATSGPERPLIVTRSKTVKVLRSGRSRALHSSSPWKKDKESNHHQHHVNGYAKNLKNRALNGISSSKHRNNNHHHGASRDTTASSSSSRTRSPNKNSSTSSPGKIRSSAYAKHYKSYRRNSSTTRRNLMLSRSPSTPPPPSSSSSPSSPQRNQRSLKFKSTTPNSGRLRLRPGDLHGTTRTTQQGRRPVQKVNIEKRKPKNRPTSPLTNGARSPIQSSSHSSVIHPNRLAKSRSTSASSSTCSTPLSSPKFSKDKDKDKVQRRSALWVLNCEAEEFLFGETAADKHELELPPSSSVTSSSPHEGDSPPPKKRRRWRETELSHLLETSPFLESKLRSSSSSNSTSPADQDCGSSSSGRESPYKNGQRLVNNHSSPSPNKKRVNIKLKFDQERRPQKYKNGNSSSAEPSPQKGRKNGKVVKSMKTFRRRFEDISEEKSAVTSATTTTQNVEESEGLRDFGASSFINFNCELLSPRSNNSVDKALQLRETLEQVKWTYSFETPCVDESWYSTFNRRADFILSYKSFLVPPTFSGPPILLPYQLDKSQLLRRSRKKKLAKNSRKSPRCHASTLAILSSTDTPLVGAATTCSSSESPLSSPSKPSSSELHHNHHPHNHRPSLPPISALHSAPCDASLEALLISTHSTAPQPVPPLLSPFTKFVSENSVRITRKRNSSAQDPYLLYQRTQQQQSSSRAGAVSAAARSQSQQEDVLTAQQYLWDSIQFLSDPYVVSILAGDDPMAHLTTSTTSTAAQPYANANNNNRCSNKVSSISTRTRHASSKSVGRGGQPNVPPPKGSPAKGSGGSTSTNNNGINGKNGLVTTVPHPLRSPPPQNTRSSSNKPPMSPTLYHYNHNNTKSPVVAMTDIFKKQHNKKSRGSLVIVGEDKEEELLFVGDGLPALPSW